MQSPTGSEGSIWVDFLKWMFDLDKAFLILRMYGSEMVPLLPLKFINGTPIRIHGGRQTSHVHQETVNSSHTQHQDFTDKVTLCMPATFAPQNLPGQ